MAHEPSAARSGTTVLAAVGVPAAVAFVVVLAAAALDPVPGRLVRGFLVVMALVLVVGLVGAWLRVLLAFSGPRRPGDPPVDGRSLSVE